MGKKKAPPPPDYAAIAREQAAAQQRLAAQQTAENRPDQITPYGRISWSQDPAGRWMQQTTLNPEMQAALDQQMGLQRQRSDLAGSLMSRVQADLGTPFGFSGPSNTSSSRNLLQRLFPSRSRSSSQPAATSFAGMPARQEMSGYQRLNTSLQDYAPQLSTSVAQRGVTRGFEIGGPQMSIDPMTGQLARSVQQENIQRSLNFADNPALPQFDASYRDRVASDLMQRMNPQHERQRAELETNLANRGFAVGSEAYTRALKDLNDRQAGERFNALDMAGSEAQRLFNMGMGARQQAFQEDVTGGNFANSAAQQAFNQGLTANQFQNAATQQAFQQALGAGQFGNQAQNQLFGQRMGLADLANRASSQEFNQDLAAQQFRNQAFGQMAGMDINRMNAMNQALAQQQGLEQNYAGFQNDLRARAIQEEAMRRSMSLNEMNALLSGQQISMPTFSSFTPAQMGQAPNLMGAAQNTFDAQMGAVNAANAQRGQTMNTLGNIATAAFMFSDRRLKSNIRRVGTHAIGVGIYDYTMMGVEQRGVIAQEVQKVRPDLVKRHASGFLTVNYGAL